MQSSGSQLPGPGQGSAAWRASSRWAQCKQWQKTRPSSGPQVHLVFLQRGLAVGVLSHGWTTSPWTHAQQWRPVTCEASTQQKGLSLNAHTAEGFSCRNLGWCLELEWPHRPGMAANTDPGPQRGPGLWGVNGEGLGQLASVNMWIPVGQKPWNLQGVRGSSAGPRFPVGKAVSLSADEVTGSYNYSGCVVTPGSSCFSSSFPAISEWIDCAGWSRVKLVENIHAVSWKGGETGRSPQQPILRQASPGKFIFGAEQCQLGDGMMYTNDEAVFFPFLSCYSQGFYSTVLLKFKWIPELFQSSICI